MGSEFKFELKNAWLSSLSWSRNAGPSATWYWYNYS